MVSDRDAITTNNKITGFVDSRGMRVPDSQLTASERSKLGQDIKEAYGRKNTKVVEMNPEVREQFESKYGKGATTGYTIKSGKKSQPDIKIQSIPRSATIDKGGLHIPNTISDESKPSIVKDIKSNIETYNTQLKAYEQQVQIYNQNPTQERYNQLTQQKAQLDSLYNQTNALIKQREELAKPRGIFEKAQAAIQKGIEKFPSAPDYSGVSQQPWKQELGKTVANVGMYFIPYVGEAKIGLDILSLGSKVSRGEEARLLQESPTWESVNVVGTVAGGAFISGKVISTTESILGKLSGKYVPIAKTGIKVVEGTTIPRSLEQLRKFEGTKQPTIHATLSKEFARDVTKGAVLRAIPEESGGFRKAAELFEFYRSAPEGGKPLAYGGYIGIGTEGSSKPKIVFDLFPKRYLLLERETAISKTPKSIVKQGLANVRDFQYGQSGKTFIPPENIFGRSTEGQFASATQYKQFKGSFIEKVSGELSGKFTKYQTPIETPKLFKELKLDTAYQKAYKLLGKKYRLDLIEVKTSPITKEVSGKVETGRIKTLNPSEFKSVESIPVSETSIIKFPSTTSKISSLKSSSTYTLFKPSKISSIKSQASSSISSITSTSSKISSVSSIKSVPSSPSTQNTPSKSSIPSTISYLSSSSVPSITSGSKGSNISGIHSTNKSNYFPSTTTSSKSIVSLNYQGKKKKKLVRGYITYVRRKKKWIPLAGEYPRSQAIMRGEKVALTTLAASFKVKPTYKYVEGIDTNYNPTPSRFREYRIEGNKRIWLGDTWIQKAGTRKEGITFKGARLASGGERMELLNFRRKYAKSNKSLW